MDPEVGRGKSIMRTSSPTHRTEDTEPAARRAHETSPPPIAEVEDDDQIHFTSWDCPLVHSQR